MWGPMAHGPWAMGPWGHGAMGHGPWAMGSMGHGPKALAVVPSPWLWFLALALALFPSPGPGPDTFPIPSTRLVSGRPRCQVCRYALMLGLPACPDQPPSLIAYSLIKI